MGILRHCPIHFYYCPFPAAHYTIIDQKWFCACILGAMSTLSREITIQTDPVMTGHQLLSSSSGGPRLGPSFLFYFLCFFLFLSVFFIFFTLITNFLLLPFLDRGSLGPCKCLKKSQSIKVDFSFLKVGVVSIWRSILFSHFILFLFE